MYQHVGSSGNIGTKVGNGDAAGAKYDPINTPRPCEMEHKNNGWLKNTNKRISVKMENYSMKNKIILNICRVCHME